MSFMTLMQMNDYMYMLTDDRKVHDGVLIHSISPRVCDVARPPLGL